MSMETLNPLGAPTPATDSSGDSLRESYQSLRSQFHALLALLILLIGSLGIYLYCQVTLVQRQIEEQERLLADYQQNSQPLIQDFLNRMQGFAKTNPEFAQIFSKYVHSNERTVSPPPSPVK